MDTKQEIEKLREDIRRYSNAYYTNDESLISDVEFDNLLTKLKKLESEHPEYCDPNSPTLVVGATDLTATKFQKIRHIVPMLSLSNTYNENDIDDFIKKIKKIMGDIPLSYDLEVKLDGTSISVVYKNGKLIQAITRGDGVIGEDVTQNIKQIKSLPHTLPKDIDIEIRGEIVLPLSEFHRLNNLRKKENLPEFANPRNAAAGTLHQLDSKIVFERNLDAYFYFLIDAEKLGITSHKESLAFIKSLGIQTTNICETYKTAKELIERIEFWGKERENLDYETDGMVIKVDEMKYWEMIGATSKSPRWAIAYKFPATQITTKLKDVIWQVGRTGKITPVAILEPVILSGSQVSRASLHNYDEIERKDIEIGDTVFIEKAAEIIPQVISAVKSLRDGTQKKIIPPVDCPVCGTRLVKDDGQVDLRCPNPKCPARILGEIIYFVGRGGMNITGLGDKLIEKLLNLGYIKDISDIYNLKNYRSELVKMDKMGEKSVDNLLLSIEQSKNQDYDKVLCALGIPYLGKTSSKIVAKISKNIDNLTKMSVDELLSIDGIGDKMAETIYNYFRDENNIKIIEKLKNYGVNMQGTENLDVNPNLAGFTFLFTGTLEHFKRDEIKDIIDKMGGKNVSSVTKNLDYLIVGKNAGSKLTKAKKNPHTKIITEKEFLDMINKK